MRFVAAGWFLFSEMNQPLTLTAVYQKDSEGCIGSIAEVPEVHAAGARMDETRANLESCMREILAINRAHFEEDHDGESVIRESFGVIS